MTRTDAINKLISKVYNTNQQTVLLKKERKDLEKCYKCEYKTCRSISDFKKRLPDALKDALNKSPVLLAEIEKQLTKTSALQSGIVAESVFVQSLAKIIGLKKFVDLETTSLADLPKEILHFYNFIQEKAQTACAVRYAYYNKGDFNSVLFQYGNPQTIGDATAILFQNEIIVEIKDMPALIQDIETEYDENGLLILSEKIKQETPIYVSSIMDFNSKTTIFDSFGHNVPILNEASVCVRQAAISSFVKSSLIDVLMTTNKNDELLMIKREDLTHICKDGSLLLDTKGSEIRTISKNSYKVFTPLYLTRVLKEAGVFVTEMQSSNRMIEPIYTIYKDNPCLAYSTGRGVGEKTRIRINNTSFFLFLNDEGLREFDNRYEFPLSSIRQNKVGLSIHIDIIKSKDDIKQELYPTL